MLRVSILRFTCLIWKGSSRTLATNVERFKILSTIKHNIIGVTKQYYELTLFIMKILSKI